MITQALPIDGTSAGATVDVSSSHEGFAVQFLGIAGGGTYKLESSLDGGTTWLDITKSFVDLSVGTLLAADVSANTLCIIQVPIPGLFRILATHTGTGSPGAVIGSSSLS